MAAALEAELAPPADRRLTSAGAVLRVPVAISSIADVRASATPKAMVSEEAFEAELSVD